MSVAYFVVLNSDDPGFDAFVDGKMLAQQLDDVNAIAAGLGLKALEDYAFQDLSEFGGPDMDVQWFDADEGINWACSLKQHLQDNPDGIGDTGDVVEDLNDYLRVFEEAKRRGLKWHLELDF
ncbi:MAG: hypothetical protein ACR2QR_14285 [Woeseiaceae bacterium]